MDLGRRQLLAGSGIVLTGGCNSIEPSEWASQDDNGGGRTPTLTPVDPPTPTRSPTPGLTETVDNSQSYNETISIEAGTGFAIKIRIPESFILHWTVKNESSTDLDFDVFLFTESGYREYVEVIRGESGDLDYIVGGTVQDIETSAQAAVTMEGGRYRLVVDNSDIGDAGDIGAESARRVTIKYSTRKA